MPLSPPAPLADRHVLDDFCCGVDTLDIWLKRRARANQISGATIHPPDSGHHDA
jgi:hypothetical protein